MSSFEKIGQKIQQAGAAGTLQGAVGVQPQGVSVPTQGDTTSISKLGQTSGVDSDLHDIFQAVMARQGAQASSPATSTHASSGSLPVPNFRDLSGVQQGVPSVNKAFASRSVGLASAG